MEKLTHQEEEAMLIIWSIGSGVIKDFLDKYPNPKLPYTTLASIVKNLQRKGYLGAKLYGNTYLYTPCINEEEYKNKFISGIVDNYFGNSYRKMVTYFAQKQKISTDELKDIIRIIEQDNH
jgi:BlaI family transcriptional regulator, penicillinase repressor